VLYAVYGWALEPSVAPASDFDPTENGASGNGHAVGASHG